MKKSFTLYHLFQSHISLEPQNRQIRLYFGLVESYSKTLDKVQQRRVLSIVFLIEFTGDKINLIEKEIYDQLIGQHSIFEDALVRH